MVLFSNSKLVRLDSIHQVDSVKITTEGLSISLKNGDCLDFYYATRAGVLAAYASLIEALQNVASDGDVDLRGGESDLCVTDANGVVQVL